MSAATTRNNKENNNSNNEHRTWECSCGQIKAILKGDPAINMRCHCHSCIASARFIDKQTEHSGTSILCTTKGGEQNMGDGGAWAAPYRASQVKFVTDLSDKDGKSLLKFVRVGEKGQPLRSYTTCCGTQVTNCVFPQMIALNANGIKNADGSSYRPREIPMNLNKKHSFDPDVVPKPNHSTAPIPMTLKFAQLILNPFDRSMAKHKEFFPSKEEAAIVPITWE